jgi:serine/threonine protein kinase/tetratricopeptide (TPR) repeat protein
MSDSSADRNPVERLAEEFIARRRRGEHPSLTEYVDRHPEWAEDIRELFPALCVMERLKPVPGDVTGTYVGGRPADTGSIPERMGDFRILCEVGRGGMGIVFEAEQESLGRHVALKVLPSHALRDPRHLQRFLREARAAAKLHHTNIVPVFGVGAHDGLHYYVMQFIAGSGLHDVVAELTRLRSADRPTAEAGPAPSDRGLREIARSLLTGQFTATPADLISGPVARNGHAGPEGSGVTSTEVHASAILSTSGRNFAREVARLGLQVAQALDYAHGQGVLHRDIKPSNLLLDVQGTVWVADFGLAKANAEGDNLTNEGDILGTLRYMAPERFRGQSDARSDLYGLGLTLYELLTLRPAFDEKHRDRLILQVTTEVPLRPRAINPEIPRDLETIVLKAIEHEPARRYQDAAELADDLGRFVADRPIRARPVGTLERVGKWARRKPAIAGLLSAFVAASVVGFAGVTWQWRNAVAASHAARRNAETSRRNFTHALDTVNRFCTQVSEEQLLDQPGMKPLRQRLLSLALEYYQTFQRQQGDDPSVLKELALTFQRSGFINTELGKHAEAHAAWLRARDIFEALSRARPQDVALKRQLARCRVETYDADRFGEFMSIINNDYFGDLTALTKSLVAAHPADLESVSLLGRAHAVEGIRELRRGRYSTARASLREAIKTLESVVREAPGTVEARRWLALSQMDLGFVCRLDGHPTESAQALRRALTQFGERAPAVRRNRLERAECLVELGTACLDLGEYGEAETRLDAAANQLEQLLREDPEAASARYGLAAARQGMGRLALARGRAAASDRLRHSVDVYAHLDMATLAPRDLLALAWSYVWLGRAELAGGRPEAIPLLCDRVAGVLRGFKGQLIIGDTMPQQTRDLTRVEEETVSLRAHSEADPLAALRWDVEVCQARSNKQSANLALRFELAWAQVQLAEWLARGDSHPNEARLVLDPALASLHELSRAEPENHHWRRGHARALETLARVQARSGQVPEARSSVGQAVAIAEALAQVDAAYEYDLASTLDLRGRLACSDADASTAVNALRRAIAGGFDNAFRLRTDPRLEGLRSRGELPSP